MKYTVLFTAPYMISTLERFQPVFDEHNIELIVPEVKERMEESQLLEYAGQFDGTICGDFAAGAPFGEMAADRLEERRRISN